jgi:hypothetical protein
MNVVAIDPTKGVRKSILLTNEQMEEVEQFRLHVRNVRGRMPSESAAIAELVQEGLRRFREQQERERQKKP